MDAIPSLPPYAHVTQEAVQCIAQASFRYQVPELLLHAIIHKEGGRMGQCVKNKNGTKDCGLAQINTAWTEHFAKFGIKQEHITSDTCTNIHASAYILKDNFQKKEHDWFKAVVAYNIGPNNWSPVRYSIGYKYATDVVRAWWGFQNWVDASKGIVRAHPQASYPAAQATTSASTIKPKQSALSPQPKAVPSAKESRPTERASTAFTGKGPKPLVFETP